MPESDGGLSSLASAQASGAPATPTPMRKNAAIDTAGGRRHPITHGNRTPADNSGRNYSGGDHSAGNHT